MSFGLLPEHEAILNRIFKSHLPSGEVIVYGSRAKGNYTPQSDLDLAIRGCPHLDRQWLANLKDTIEDSDFPLLVDLQFYESIKNRKLRDHICRVGKTLYKGS